MRVLGAPLFFFSSSQNFVKENALVLYYQAIHRPSIFSCESQLRFWESFRFLQKNHYSYDQKDLSMPFLVQRGFFRVCIQIVATSINKKGVLQLLLLFEYLLFSPLAIYHQGDNSTGSNKNKSNCSGHFLALEVKAYAVFYYSFRCSISS